MSSLPESLEKVTRGFQADVHALFPGHVTSLTVYGSAVTEDYAPGKSDIDLLVVLDEQGIENLQPAQKKISKWSRRRLHPLLLTEAYIERSLDSFPIEFLNMQSAYHVLEGKDVLRHLEFDRGDLRLQCEGELKGDLLHLRQRFIQTRGRKRDLTALIRESVVAFAAIFKALLYLKGEQVPRGNRAAVLGAARAYGLDEALMGSLADIERGARKPSRAELGTLVEAYIRQIRALCQQVDGMRP